MLCMYIGVYYNYIRMYYICVYFICVYYIWVYTIFTVCLSDSIESVWCAGGRGGCGGEESDRVGERKSMVGIPDSRMTPALLSKQPIESLLAMCPNLDRVVDTYLPRFPQRLSPKPSYLYSV